MTIDQFIKESREVCDKATPIPWRNDNGYRVYYGEHVMFETKIHEGSIGLDCEFIAHSRTALPKALEALGLAVSFIKAMDTQNGDLTLKVMEKILGSKDG